MTAVWRIFFIMAAINFLVLAVFVFLVTIQFEAVLSGSIRERLAVIVENVRDPFASATEMGLPLTSLRNANAMIERVKQDDEAIVAIGVYDKSGAVKLSTEAAHSPILSQYIKASSEASAGADYWSAEDDRYFAVGGTVPDAAGQPAGGVTVLYSKHDATTQVRAVAARLAFYCSAGLLAMLLILLPVLRLAMRRHVALFSGLLRAYDNFERRFWRGQGGTVAPEVPMQALGFDTGEFQSLLDLSEREYAEEKARLLPPEAGAT